MKIALHGQQIIINHMWF